MRNVIKKVPIPIAGLMLALATTGNLVLSYGVVFRNIFGIISACVLLLILMKMFTYPTDMLEHVKNPVVASVAPTFTMGLILLSTYIKPYFPTMAVAIWISSILLHCVFIIYFTQKYIFNFNIKNVFPSYFIVYVGIVVVSVTAPAFNLLGVGQAAFWFGFITYICLFIIVLYRLFVIKEIPEPALPTVAIMAAPASLCLAGYLASFQVKSTSMVVFLGGLSLMMFIGVLIYLPTMLKIKFYPSYSSFTFPLAISAVAMKQSNVFLIKIHKPIYALKYLVNFQEILAVLIIMYVLVLYTDFVFFQNSSKQ